MKKKISIALAVLLVMAVALSIRAHATEIGSSEGGTTIAITDITPREDEKDETTLQKNYTVGSYFPVQVQTAEDHGVQLLVKTFLVPEGTDPQTLVEGDLTRRETSYEVSDILRREMPEDVEKKAVTQTVTMDSETDKLEEILPLLQSSMDYQENGFSGTLVLDKGSVQAKEAGTSSYSYQLKETKEYTGLDRNDPYYIPKTTEKNGVTLSLANVDWTPMASAADNSDVPSLFRATALYTGTVWGNKADGYTITADYTGEVSRTTPGDVMYSIFAVIPDNDSSFNFLVGMLYTQLFQQLYYQADVVHGGRLPVHVHFVMDEFANVALPDEFDKLLATMRSREISVSIIIQNLAQLKTLFEKQWESIVGNCDEFLYLGGNEQSTHEYVSKLLGKETIDLNTYGQSKGRNGSYSTNWQLSGRELLTPDEVRMLDNRYSLLFIRGERPIRDLKYDILRHPNVKLTADGGARPFLHGEDTRSIAALRYEPALAEQAKDLTPEIKDHDFLLLTEEELEEYFKTTEV